MLSALVMTVRLLLRDQPQRDLGRCRAGVQDERFAVVDQLAANAPMRRFLSMFS